MSTPVDERKAAAATRAASVTAATIQARCRRAGMAASRSGVGDERSGLDELVIGTPRRQHAGLGADPTIVPAGQPICVTPPTR
ncbi:hypothetical protein [Arsenicicoccus piscis]|nr:hypothetical protein [Arsenicicoccus piscis]